MTSREFRSKLERIQTLYKIKDKRKRVVNCKFNPTQWQIVEDIQNQDPIRHFTLKSRQTGVSTFWLLWWLDETIFESNVTTGILAHKWESLNLLWDIIEFAYENFPYRLPLKQESAKALEFRDNSSKIFISLSIRGVGLHNLHISEWCLCRDEEIKATLGACSPYTNISGESTGQGVGNDGYLVYQDAKTNDNEYKPRFIAWFLAPEYALPLKGIDPQHIMRNLNSEETRLQKIMKDDYNMTLTPEQVLFRKQKRNALKDLFPQEYPETDEDAFITSGDHYFNLKKWLALLEEAREWLKGEDYHEKTNDYTCFHPPNRRDSFVAGADTSEGVEDYNVLKIINVTQRKEAFVYRAKSGIPTFYKVCDKWCRAYNNALLAVEDNNTGHAVLLGLEEDCKYRNLYKEKRGTRIGGKIQFKLGWHTDKISRTQMLIDLKYAVEEDDAIDVVNFHPEFMIFDENLLKEALTFIKQDGKYEAEAGKNDDDIFATGIAFQLYLLTTKMTDLKKGVLIGREREQT